MWVNLLFKFRHKILYHLSDFVTIVNGSRLKTNKVLLKYKNKYAGQLCFIIGNGPSLSPKDLTILKEKGIITFASNRIFKIFCDTEWRPDFYAIFDESVADKSCIEENNRFSCKEKFFRSQGWYRYHRIKDGLFMHSWNSRKYLDEPHFSSDLTKGIYTIATVTYVHIQLARYMGFTNIYLLGMDNRYKFGMTREGNIFRNENVLSYFGEKEKDESLPKQAPATWEMDVAFNYAEKFSRENGFRIYNATRGGFLEKFERVDFDKIMSQF